MNERIEAHQAVGALAVAMMALLLFAPGLLGGFAYDDVPIVVGDPRIRSLANLPAILTGGYWQSADLALYRPVTTLSFAIDWSLAPGSAAWFHFTNVLLHAGTSVLVYLLIARIFGAAAALAGGLLFAAHPVHVEAVANIVGRAELLSALFFTGCCLLWSRPDDERRGPVAPAILFVLAILSKESAIMLPVALILLDAATGRLRPDNLRDYVRRNRTAIGVLAAVAIAYVAMRLVVLGTLTPARVDPLLQVATSTGARISTALQAWPVWARLLFFPDRLLADYGPGIIEPAGGLSSGAIAGAAIAAGLTAAGLVSLARGRGRLALVLLWFPITILPVSNLVVPIGVLVAERTLYLPSISVSFALAAVAAAPAFATRRAFRLGTAAVTTALALFAIRVVARIPDWRSTDSVMQALVRDQADSYRGHWHLARMARERDDVTAAIAQYDTAVVLWPHRRNLLIEAAGYAATRGRLPRAAVLAALAVQQWPADLDVQRMQAGVALDMGDLATAERAVGAGLDIDPDDAVLRSMAAALDSIRTAPAGRQ